MKSNWQSILTIKASHPVNLTDKCISFCHNFSCHFPVNLSQLGKTINLKFHVWYVWLMWVYKQAWIGPLVHPTLKKAKSLFRFEFTLHLILFLEGIPSFLKANVVWVGAFFQFMIYLYNFIEWTPQASLKKNQLCQTLWT